MKPEKQYIYIAETKLGSFINDGIAIGWVVVAFYLNQRFIDGNNFLDLALFILFFVTMFTKQVSKRTGLLKMMTPDEAREFLSKGD